MKKQSLVTLFLGLAFFAFALFAAPTETSAKSYGIVMTVDITFDFHVNNKKFEAGKYEIQRLSQDTFLIRQAEGDQSIMVAATAGAGNALSVKQEKIVFQRYGKQYFLREIYQNRQATGRMLYESKTERRARKEVAETENNLAQNQIEKIEVVARLK
jgi:hypothetical protein